jgi:hypothetical protein
MNDQEAIIPHARPSCPLHPFPFNPRVVELTRLYCRNCYCYICGVGVTPVQCPFWLYHSGETGDNPASVDRHEYWRDNGRGAMVRPPRRHARADCPDHPFNNDGEANDVGNMRFCNYCYCFICERQPNLCDHWDLHACATLNNSLHVAWRTIWWQMEAEEEIQLLEAGEEDL